MSFDVPTKSVSRKMLFLMDYSGTVCNEASTIVLFFYFTS